MLENMLLKKKANVLFELDMSPPAGSQVLADLVSGVVLTRVPGGSTADGFVDHPTYGHCYRFNGGTYFTGKGALSTFPFATTGSYLVEAEFATDTTAFQCIFETGDYPPSSNIKSGSSLTSGQFANQFLQWFQVMLGGTFQRTLLSASNPLTMGKYSVKRTAAGTVISDVTRGLSNSIANFNTGGDTYFVIGAAFDGSTPGYFFTGYLKSLRFSKA